MHDVIDKILFDEKDLLERIGSLKNRLEDHFAGSSNVLVLPILEGANLLCQALKDHGLDMQKFTFIPIKASSYGNETSSSGNVSIDLCDCHGHISGSDVLILDDIFDTGNTMASVIDELETLSPASIATCVLLHRLPHAHESVKPDFTAAAIETDEFLIGFGMDYKGQLRELPFIATLRKELR